MPGFILLGMNVIFLNGFPSDMSFFFWVGWLWELKSFASADGCVCVVYECNAAQQLSRTQHMKSIMVVDGKGAIPAPDHLPNLIYLHQNVRNLLPASLEKLIKVFMCLLVEAWLLKAPYHSMNYYGPIMADPSRAVTGDRNIFLTHFISHRVSVLTVQCVWHLLCATLWDRRDVKLTFWINNSASVLIAGLTYWAADVWPVWFAYPNSKNRSPEKLKSGITA